MMPRKSGDLRSVILRVRLTEREYERLRAKAEEEGDSAADYVRFLVRLHTSDALGIARGQVRGGVEEEGAELG